MLALKSPFPLSFYKEGIRFNRGRYCEYNNNVCLLDDYACGICRFSPDEIAKYNEPTITILKVIELTIIERLEIVLFALYIFVMSTKVLPLMFVSVFSTSWLFGKEEHTKPLFWLLVFSVIYVTLFPPSVNISLIWSNKLEKLSFLFTYAFPICFGDMSSSMAFLKGGASNETLVPYFYDYSTFNDAH